MISIKTIIAGTNGSGKTTLLKNLSEVPPHQFELSNGAKKKNTEEAEQILEFGRLTIKEDVIFQLYSTSLDIKLINVWKSLENGLVGVIVLMDGSSLNSLEGYKQAVKYLSKQNDLAVLYILTKVPKNASESRIKEVKDLFKLENNSPVFLWDSSDKHVERKIIAALCKRYKQLRESTSQYF